MLKICLTLIMLLMLGCSQIKMNKKSNYFMDFNTINKEVARGEVTTISFNSDFPETYKVTCKNNKDKRIDKILLGIINGKKVGFVSIDYFYRVGSVVTCIATKEKKEHVVANIKVVDKDFSFERLYVDKKRVTLNKKDRQRVWREQKFLNSNYFNPSEIALFEKPFDIPLDSHVTSVYGTGRIFNKKKKTQHLGTDYRAKIGTEIKATSGGVVVVSRDLFYTGNTVTIDHGLGIFTVYGHLSKLVVKEGDRVRKGDLIAYSGNTGRTSGPHLHWGVKIHNRYIDGDSLVKVTQELFD